MKMSIKTVSPQLKLVKDGVWNIRRIDVRVT